MTTLSSETLASLPADVARPSYDRSQLRVGIVHLGVGGFHRAHQAMYLDRLMNAGLAADWGICGVGVLPSDRRMAEALAAQDHLYTLVVKHPDGAVEPRVIGSMVDYLFAPDDPAAVVDRLTDPGVRIVTLTITEGGYHLHPGTGRFQSDDEGIRRDLEPGAVPRTTFGLLTEALSRRRQRGVPPFTVVSCDNIQGNGDVARQGLSAFADLREPGLGGWIRQEVRFPNSMVDRITPVTTDADRTELAQRFGVIDRWPVVCESFAQWVLEETPGERPPLEEAGVQLVEDVAPYELMKLRLLNAGHQAIAYLGYLAGHRFIHEACEDPVLARFLRAYMDREATPTLEPVPGIDLEAYKGDLLTRFSSPSVRDTLARNATNTSDRIPTFLLPVVRRNLERGGPVELSAAVVAGWARYAEGTDEQGHPIEVDDPLRDTLMAAAASQLSDPLAFLRIREVFGDLVDDERFTTPYLAALDSLHRHGARATVQSLVG
jgi:mannitol 2-dehydrogenase